MQRLKLILLSLTILIAGSAALAQNIEEGKKLMNYEKYISAQGVFSSLVSANANNIDAVYWLGQAMIANNNLAGAKALYQKTLMNNPNAALLLAGMGHVELLENKTNDARQRFETAISLSKAKDAAVLNAIGKANAEAKAGDGAYAIDKLKQATDLNKKNPDIWVNLGNAYRKMADGSNALQAYQNALAIDPNYARASFMIGKMYQTQGPNQEAVYMQYYNDAIAKDPNFTPVYELLATYYYTRNIIKAKDYLDKYVGLADANSRKCYLQAAYFYALGNNKGAIDKANQCITTSGNDVYPNLYGIEAYAYNKLGDSLNAKKYFDTYFQKQTAENLGPNDYATYSRVLLKFPGNEAMINTNMEKAIMADTIPANRIDYINSIASTYLAVKDYANAAYWYNKLLFVKRDFGKTDLYNAGYNYYRSDKYTSADSVFTVYISKYPEDIFGYNMAALAEARIDSTGQQGLAKGNYEKVISLSEASTDTTVKKDYLIPAYNYMVAYYYNTKSDKATAISYLDKILAIDPTNERALENKKKLLAAPVLKSKTTGAGKTKEKGEDTKVKTKPGASKEKAKTPAGKVKGKG
jgi:tetratricopeptide (TPR) repeat protein